MSNPDYNAGSSADVGQRTKGVKLRKLQQSEDLRSVLDSYKGRAVLWRLLEQCGVYRLSYSGEALESAFKEGNRQIGLWLLSEIQSVVPGAYLKMQQEAMKRV